MTGMAREASPSSQAASRTRSGAGPDVAVIAFGGNAIMPAGKRWTPEEQEANLTEMARQVAALVGDGWMVAITHGNGPQVGNILLQQEATRDEVPAMPLDVCGAMSQGQIGYLLQRALYSQLALRGMARPVVTVVTQCLVDGDDEAFKSPSKPIGPFYDEATAERLRLERGWTIVADAGRGYRRVVPSPLPREIVERDVVRLLVRSGVLVIACGGGGVPVVRDAGVRLRGVEGVIDKDLAACLLAREVGARTLVLLTGASGVFVHFGTPNQRQLEDVTLAEVEAYAAEGHFPQGSMGPKIQAAIQFLRGGGERVVITSPPLLRDALRGAAGTRIWRLAPARTASRRQASALERGS